MENRLTTHQLSEELDQQRGPRHLQDNLELETGILFDLRNKFFVREPR